MLTAVVTATPEIAVLTRSEFDKFQDLIYRETGIVLREGKRQLLVSRLARRLKILRLNNFSDYYDLLMSRDPQRNELMHMTNCITTNKTDFFREPHHFEFLRKRVTAAAETGSARGKSPALRIWSAGCSTGEEPYTIAITIHESLPTLPRWDVRILATDIDTEVLRTAQAGAYPAGRLGGLSAERRRNYFEPAEPEGSIQARPELQQLIAFRRLNLIGDGWPMKKRFNFIFCRNVMIYFDRPTQERLLRRFTDFLEPEGYLFVGHAESLYWAREWLTPVGHTIYRLPQANAAR